MESSGSLSILPENSYGTTIIPINDNELLFSGITGFRQNKPPAGMSLYDNGKAFISKYSFPDKKLLTSSYRKSLRKDMVTSMIIDNSKLNILIDSDGPLTHSADTDAMQAYQKSSLIEFSDFNILF